MSQILKYSVCLLLLMILVSCEENSETNNESQNVTHFKNDLELNKFSNVNISENVAVNWESVKKTEKGNFKISEISAYEKAVSTLESNFLEHHLKYQIVTIESEGQLHSYFVEVYTNKGSNVYPETITKLNGFTGTLNVFLLNGENLGSVAINSGKARNISENDDLNVLEESINAFMTNSNATNKMPQCGGNYTVTIDQTISRFDVWTNAGEIIAINYIGTTTTRTTSIMPYPCDGIADKSDIFNQRLESYNFKNGSGGIPVTADYILPPSCESFNFLPDGSLWQVAMVKNINFRVLGVSPSGIQILHVLSYPQAVYFGTPTNVKVGNTSITAGIAANTSARVLQQSMQEVIDKYGGSDVSDLILDQYFRERLTHNYPLFVPGGRVNFNSTSNIPATNYKTNTWTAGNCN